MEATPAIEVSPSFPPHNFPVLLTTLVCAAPAVVPVIHPTCANAKPPTGCEVVDKSQICKDPNRFVYVEAHEWSTRAHMHIRPGMLHVQDKTKNQARVHEHVFAQIRCRGYPARFARVGAAAPARTRTPHAHIHIGRHGSVGADTASGGQKAIP